MNERRISQLERAAKLRANVSVLLGDRGGAPDVFELASVKRTSLERATRVWVQVISWHDPEPYAQIVVRDNGTYGVGEDELAEVVDKALDAFEARGKRQAAT